MTPEEIRDEAIVAAISVCDAIHSAAYSEYAIAAKAIKKTLHDTCSLASEVATSDIADAWMAYPTLAPHAPTQSPAPKQPTPQQSERRKEHMTNHKLTIVANDNDLYRGVGRTPSEPQTYYEPVRLEIPRSPVANWYRGDKPDREISHEGFELGLFATNHGDLYRTKVQPLLERIAKAARGKYYTRRWELRQWLAYVSEAIPAYRTSTKQPDAAFAPDAVLEAALHTARHYRDELAETHGIVIEDLEQSK